MGVNARVVQCATISGVVDIIAGIADAVCGTLGCILILDGHLAGIVENSRTGNGTAIVVLADQLYAGSIIHSQIAVYCNIFTGNTQLTGAGDICISENRSGLSAGKGHIRCVFNDQLTLEHRVSATIQINDCIRSVDGQISHMGIVQAQGVGVLVIAQSTIAEDISIVDTVDGLAVHHDTVFLVQPCNAAAAVDAHLHQRIGAFGQCRGRQREHHARCQSSGCCALGQFLLSHLCSPFTFTARTGL